MDRSIAPAIGAILVAGVCFFGAARADAASPDCARVETEARTIVCDNPLLAKLDGEMAAKFRAALKGLSAQGARALRQNQAQFLSAAQRCPDTPDADACLWALYSSRIADLDIVSERVGPYRFLRLVKYAVSDQRGGGVVGANSLHIFRTPYPQIDRPVASALGQWNAIADGRAAVTGLCDSGGGDANAEYRIKQATDRLIIVEYSERFDCPGAAHGFGGVRTQSYLVKPKLKPLEASDMFAPGEGWQTVLAGACAVSAGDGLNAGLIQNLRHQVENPTRWIPRREGLEVFYTLDPPDAESPHLDSAFVPWDKLKPYLRADAPIPH